MEDKRQVLIDFLKYYNVEMANNHFLDVSIVDRFLKSINTDDVSTDRSEICIHSSDGKCDHRKVRIVNCSEISKPCKFYFSVTLPDTSVSNGG
jgi:hypothetical protein